MPGPYKPSKSRLKKLKGLFARFTDPDELYDAEPDFNKGKFLPEYEPPKPRVPYVRKDFTGKRGTRGKPTTETRLTTLPEVVATPHIAGSTEEAQELVGVEAAASVRDYLRLGIIRNAVNFPAIAPEETQRLQPFVNLAQKIGAFVAQLAKGRIKTVSIRYYGELATGKNELLVGAVLMGLFKTMLSTTVSLINARALARDRNVEVIESHSTRPRDFTSLLAVRLDSHGFFHAPTGEFSYLLP